MQLAEFAKKAGTVILSVFILLNMINPAFAFRRLITDRYPVYAPEEGVRMSFTDSDEDLGNFVFDFASKSGKETYDLGTTYIYGNRKNDDDGADSYDDLIFGFSTKPDEFAFVSKNISNSKNHVFDVIAYDGSEIYKYTEVKDEPSTSTSALQNFYKNALETTGSGVSMVGDSLLIRDVLTQNIGSSDQQIGDPDIMTDYFDELYIYVKYENNEYVYYLNIDLGSALQDESTDEVSSVKVITRGTASRIDIGLPKDISGIVDYKVELEGVEDTSLEYYTHYPVVFFQNRH